MTTAESRETTTGRATLVALVLGAVVVALAGAFAWHSVATRAYSATFSASRTVEERAASAATAGGLEPWNPRFTKRARVMAGWLLGKQLLDSGDYNGAIVALDAAYRLDIGDAELLALYKKAQAIQALDTNRKAHLQHGHEGLGGTLTPGDVER